MTAFANAGKASLLAVAMVLCLTGTGLAQQYGDFTYSVDDGNVTITGYTGAGGDVVIPATIEDMDVVAIGDEAFMDRTDIVGVVIPEGVLAIGAFAFFGCTALEEIALPDSVAGIGGHAFRWCSSLASVTVGTGIETLGSSVFRDCAILDAIVFLGNAPVETGADIFTGSDAAAVYRVAGTQGWEATFAGHPVSLLDLGTGLVYAVDVGDTVVVTGYIGGGGAVTVPAFVDAKPVAAIGADAFRDRADITGVSLPDSVAGIGASAFRGCAGLAGVTLPASVAALGESAFRDCTGLAGVYFHGDAPGVGSGVFTGSSPTVYRLDGTAGWPAFGETWAGRPTEVWDLDTVATPVFNPDGGAFVGASVEVTVASATDGAVVRYTTDGSEPTEASPEVDGGVVQMPLPGTLKARAWKDGVPPSATRSAEYLAATDPAYFEYTVIGETVRIDKCMVVAGPVVIPNFIEGRPVTAIGTGAFRDKIYIASVTIPDSVISIGRDAFRDCTGLTSVTIPDSVTTIGNSAFSGCTSLASVTIPAGVTSIGTYAFVNCSSLTSVTIGNSVTSIGYAAFMWCSSLASVTIPDSVTSIGGAAFRGCTGLTTIDVAEDNVIYSSLDGVLFDKQKLILIQCPAGSEIAHYAIPDTVMIVGMAAFADSASLQSVTIPDSVTSIGDWAFYNCSSLTSVVIGNSVTSIGSRVFQGCISLQSLTIPGSVTSIGSYAFYGCSGLQGVYFLGDAPSVGSSVFGWSSPATIYRMPDTDGWPEPGENWAGRPTALWDGPPVATPMLDPDGGEHVGPSIGVAATCATEGATLRYTADGSEPAETSSEVVGGTVMVPVPGTLKVKAWKEGMAASETVTAVFTGAPPAATPVFVPDRGVFSGSSVDVTVTCATEGATLRYTTDGSEPAETSSEVVGGAVTAPVPGTLKVKAWKEGMTPSPVAEAEYLSRSLPEHFDVTFFPSPVTQTQDFDDWPGAPFTTLGTYTNAGWVVKDCWIRGTGRNWPEPASDPHLAWLGPANSWVRSPLLEDGAGTLYFAVRNRVGGGQTYYIQMS